MNMVDPKTYSLFLGILNARPQKIWDYVANAPMQRNAGSRITAAEQATGYTTARTLLSILRLAQALRSPWMVKSSYGRQDINEALRLMKMSKMSLTTQVKHSEDDRVTLT